MEKDYLISNKYINKENNCLKIKKIQNAKKSLNNYINQLKIHFDLNDDEIFSIIKALFESKRNNNLLKKWWQIWK